VSAAEEAGAPAEFDASQVDPAEFARNVAAASDEQLREGMASPLRGQILAEIFGRMAEHFRPESARDTDAVIHWRIGGRADGGHDEWETVIRDGTCEVHEGLGTEQPRVAFTIDGADFLRLVTGNAAGPMLFMSGKLKIEGDMMFAARAASLFTIPTG
jgi:putative sterol carrier protein